jgi:hypothetical protein
VGATRTHHRPTVAVVPRGGSGGRPGGEHPLLALQRAAGNQAVAQAVQRKKHYKIHYQASASSRVASAPMDSMYFGKCDAEVSGAAVRKSSWPDLTGRNVTLVFECGPQSFEFFAYHPWIGKRFPWTMNGPDGASAWLVDDLPKALDDIYADFDDHGSRFWNGYHVVTERLADDVRNYCQCATAGGAAQEPARSAPPGGFHLSVEGSQSATPR